VIRAPYLALDVVNVFVQAEKCGVMTQLQQRFLSAQEIKEPEQNLFAPSMGGRQLVSSGDAVGPPLRGDLADLLVDVVIRVPTLNQHVQLYIRDLESTAHRAVVTGESRQRLLPGASQAEDLLV
jgi:hypothetical protein